MLKVTTIAEGAKNLTVLIKGTLTEELALTPVLKVDQLVKLESALWLVQEKAGLLLWWEKGNLIMPMESRNFIRLDIGWNSPRGDWDRTILMSSFGVGQGPKAFTVVLDFDKQ